MTDNIFKFPAPFAKNTKKPKVSITLIDAKDFPRWIEKQEEHIQYQVAQKGFEAKPAQVIAITEKDGKVQTLLASLNNPVHYLDTAPIVQFIQTHYSTEFINARSFEITSTHEEDVCNKIAIGWGLAAYKFDIYKKNDTPTPELLWPKKANQKEVTATIESVCLIRNLVNTPPNILGTDELADAAKEVAKQHKAKIKIIRDDELLKKNFPLIYNVGKASTRPPQLVDIKWGSSKHPKITIVGKGVIYDTGGLNLKPGMYMRDMKKDMGGAAHALGLAWMIMALDLPIQLRVLLPIVENAVAGNSYRPGDVLTSRKGITIEVDDTDAEGRLVVADALTYASEDDPDLLVDFCTLTGAARVALGYDIPAFFSNREKFIKKIAHSSLEKDDPVWPLPLWKGYEKEMDSNIADLINGGAGRAGAIHAGLFLQRFIDSDIDWIHLDCFAWEQNGKAGRPKGGSDTGMRAILNLIRDKYA